MEKLSRKELEKYMNDNNISGLKLIHNDLAPTKSTGMTRRTSMRNKKDSKKDTNEKQPEKSIPSKRGRPSTKEDLTKIEKRESEQITTSKTVENTDAQVENNEHVEAQVEKIENEGQLQNDLNKQSEVEIASPLSKKSLKVSNHANSQV